MKRLRRMRFWGAGLRNKVNLQAGTMGSCCQHGLPIYALLWRGPFLCLPSPAQSPLPFPHVRRLPGTLPAVLCPMCVPMDGEARERDRTVAPNISLPLPFSYMYTNTLRQH